MTGVPTSWSTVAVNLPDHADNLIHTDEGAIAAGFERALVAGTTVYAYLTHPLTEAWGMDWLTGGGGELRLRHPVFDRQPVDCVVDRVEPDRCVVSAMTDRDDQGGPRATFEAWRQADAPAPRDGDPLPSFSLVLDQSHLDYGLRAGDNLGFYAEHNIAPPVVWANLANMVFNANLVTGPWIHVRSRIVHQGVAEIGRTVEIESVLIDRFDSRAGERALVDMLLRVDDQPVATIEHEAIITVA